MLNKVALITGSTRGIGRNIAEKLAANDYNVVITGKTKPDIKHVVSEIKEKGNEASGFCLDLRDEVSIENVVKKTINKYGKIDVLINNASAMWWFPIEGTPFFKYDLVNDVNVRGTYLMSQECIPFMSENSHIITHSPPITSQYMDRYLNGGIKNKIAYMNSKLGMSIVASGLAQELANRKISSNCIWPKTAIETNAMKDNPLIPSSLNDARLWRKPDIIGDMVNELVNEEYSFTNQFLIDEEYLRKKIVTDFKQYRCVADYEPPPLLDLMK
jgi:citronellol/citronellal dehydrogenase